jgi:hypothetical protein
MKIYIIRLGSKIWLYRSQAAAIADPDNPLNITARTWLNRRNAVKLHRYEMGHEAGGGYPFAVGDVVVDCLFAKGMGDLKNDKNQSDEK